MKKIIVCLFLLSGCALSDGNIKDFIPGMYVKEFQQQYASGNDTLVITIVDETTNSYNIERHLSYIPVHDGKVLNRQNETTTWYGIYSKNNKQMIVQPNGKIISFSPEKNCLYIGNSTYKKVK
ncbi:hypothetical protein [Parafilimonas sp.]|uniref:hypothetical protein n=1 Tax=Parafilimonas sp. TaxID=1969739 RepID=UPI003F7DCE9D